MQTTTSRSAPTRSITVRSRSHISLYAASSRRRAWLSDFVHTNLDPEKIKIFTSLQSLRQGLGEGVEILIADLATPREATAYVELVEHWPDVFASVVLIDSPGPDWLEAAVGAGTNAILSREPRSEELRLAVDAADAGLVLLQPAGARNLTGGDLHASAPMGESNELEELTPREREVLLLMSAGLGNKQIAARLAISEHTAKFHISSILGKLSVGSRTEAVSQGIRRGLIPI